MNYLTPSITHTRAVQMKQASPSNFKTHCVNPLRVRFLAFVITLVMGERTA